MSPRRADKAPTAPKALDASTAWWRSRSCLCWACCWGFPHGATLAEVRRLQGTRAPDERAGNVGDALKPFQLRLNVVPDETQFHAGENAGGRTGAAPATASNPGADAIAVQPTEA